MKAKMRSATAKTPRRKAGALRSAGRIIAGLARLIVWPLLALWAFLRWGGAAVGSRFARTRVDPRAGDYVQRFDFHQRVQHVLMFTSFLTLAFTGLPQKFHTLDASQWLIATLGGLEQTQHIHHIAAFVMLFDCAYHGIYVAYNILVRRKFGGLQMIPTPKDFFDAMNMFKYFLGFTEEKPRFGRFSYLEKFDYWAVFWGIAVIGGSGLVLLFPVQVSKLVPGEIVPISLAAHSDEAVLAVSWIFLVHFFYAHFAPAIFPFNPSIFTGRVPKHRYAEEHPLEYERMFGEPAEAQAATGHRPTSAPPAPTAEPQPVLASSAAAPGEQSTPEQAG